MICGALVVAISLGCPLWALAAWALPLILVSGAGFFAVKPSVRLIHCVRRSNLQSHRAALGCWRRSLGCYLPVFGWFGGLAEILGIWSVCVAMMVYASMLMPSVPIARNHFYRCCHHWRRRGWVIAEQYYLAVAAAALGLLLIVGVIRTAQSQILYQLASNVLQEKTETVSLLLRRI